ncbi:RNA polymerase specificity factor [Lachancea thermotolerans CBS 6340]|uniref:rRNA adenine N(6)-methyltransferase n=1 Tax=Lachancea thermotolerans (strain ATCC 56472 / CBS 6340 / NRRL Y-8284) TaxID=559295 RepID=C5DF87_LACTC|nr:KLTH0D13112p [Lachancea thermotolerans CBS 6340]CAR22842.1 KLTH0D13112p [Lachancea thermotolerans CBS 6340]
MAIRVQPLRDLAKIQHYYGFRYLLNPGVHEKIFDKLDLPQTYQDTSKLKVLDLYPGPGQHSAIFHNRFKPLQHVLMDARPDFVKHLRGLSSTQNDSFQLYGKDPYEWQSYTDLIDVEKKFVPSKRSLDSIHDEFLVLANLTGMVGEGLFMQWLACVGNRNWLHRFGRVKMLVWVLESTAMKILARPGDQLRSKCSVVADTFTDTKLVATMETKNLHKFGQGVIDSHKPVLFPENDVWMPSGKPISLLEVNPSKHNIDLDNFDYVTKHLLILRSTPLCEAFESLGHGGRDYFTTVIKDKKFLRKCPKELTSSEFLMITEAFVNWPFKPDIYMDFIDVFQDND